MSAILEQGRIGETYLIGADGEENNKIVALILELTGKPADAYDLVSDRPATTCATRSTRPSSRAELGWAPQYERLPRRSRATIDWYRDNEDWWTGARAQSEKVYERLGR